MFNHVHYIILLAKIILLDISKYLVGILVYGHHKYLKTILGWFFLTISGGGCLTRTWLTDGGTTGAKGAPKKSPILLIQWDNCWQLWMVFWIKGLNIVPIFYVKYSSFHGYFRLVVSSWSLKNG